MASWSVNRLGWTMVLPGVHLGVDFHHVAALNRKKSGKCRKYFVTGKGRNEGARMVTNVIERSKEAGEDLKAAGSLVFQI